ncbi:MAG TPA: VOC family protein [Amycolatopsis sp.]|nr:VOC family protein [Amycolatopsis sp.]
MALHGLSYVVMGVPDAATVAGFYADFGLDEVGPGRFATVDGGEQLRIVPAAWRHVVEVGVAADDPDDLGRIRSRLAALDIACEDTDPQSVTAYEEGTGIRVRVLVAPRITQEPAVLPAYNLPGQINRDTARSEAVLRTDPVRPRKLGHVVIGSVDQKQSQRFFVEGLGFKVSDEVVGRAAFLRCSTDHHNILVQNSPARFLHHTSWQVEDVDEVGRGATSMLAADPGRHVWGLGRHHIGSNFFWYLRDPGGNFAEYYSDLDCIVEDQLWDPRVFDAWDPASPNGRLGLYNWGPPPPPSFLKPDDLAELMAESH